MALERFQEHISAPSYYLAGNPYIAYVDKTVTVAQMLALNATPVTIVGAPGANKALIFESAVLYKPAGTAYAGVAAGEDLVLKYTGAAGLQVGSCEATGFLDAATAQTRFVHGYRAASLVSEITPVANSPLVIHMLVGEVTTGDSVLRVRTFYRIVAMTF